MLEVQRRRGASLSELHIATGLPKATLLRMLVTLSGRGLVWQRLADNAYLPHADAVARSRFDAPERIAEIASPHLATLCSVVAWPSVLAVPRLDHVEIIETNSPLMGTTTVLGPVGLKLSYLHTATGRTYHAACGEDERNAIIARLRPKNATPESMTMLEDIIREGSARGYSLREPLHSWPDRSRQMIMYDRRRSMGVAVISNGQPVASINITWPTRYATDEEVVARHLGALKATARAIGKALESDLPSLTSRGRTRFLGMETERSGAQIKS